MENKRKNKRILIIALLIVSILVIGTIADTLFYFNGEITNLNGQVANLKSQISMLSGQVTNLSSPYLVSALGTHELSRYTDAGWLNYLYIGGTVINTGRGTAYNAGLLVLVYNNGTGALEINITVPLGSGKFEINGATDNRIPNFVNNSLQLGYLLTEQTAIIDVSIFHRGTVSNWTVTPVYTNSP